MLPRVEVLPKEQTTSSWFAAMGKMTPAYELAETLAVDWLIVGAGWVGLAAARRLAELCPDARIALIDAMRIGNGPGGRSAGFAIDLAHNPRKAVFLDDRQTNSEEKTVNLSGIDYLRRGVETHALDCDWDPRGKIHAASSDGGDRRLEVFAAELEKTDEPFSWIDRDGLHATVGSRHYRRGLLTPGTVLLDPAKTPIGLARTLPENVDIYESTPATSLRLGPPHDIITPLGHVPAENLMLTANGFISHMGFFESTAIPIYTYASMTRPLTSKERDSVGREAGFRIIPADPFGTIVRRTQDRRLFFRNVYSFCPGYRTTEVQVDYARSRHQRSFEARFPEVAEIGLAHTWGGALTLAQNGGVIFGEVRENVFAAGYCNGTGIARGTAWGKTLAELAAGHDHELIAIMKRKRPPARAWPQAILSLVVRSTMAYRLWRAGV